MGKANQGIFGGWTKKVGNVVGRIVQGQNVYSIYQPNVSNPRTLEQQENRAKFTLLSRFMSAMLPAIRLGFRNLDGYTRGSAYSAALGYNSKLNIVGGTYPNYEVVVNKAIISEGSVALPFNASGSAEGGEYTASWADNSGQGDAEASDIAVVVLYNKTRGVCVVGDQTSKRSDRTAKASIPTEWTGDTGNAYLFMMRERNRTNSMSQHLGALTF